MICLALSVFFNALIFVFFKWLANRRSNTFLVVVFNYFVAGAVALAMSGVNGLSEMPGRPWFLPAVALGAVFVFVFYLMAVTTREAGASRAVIANKISLIIPVLAALFLYGDRFDTYKGAGLLFTILGLVFLLSGKDGSHIRRSAFLVILLFFLSGVMDASLKYIQHYWLAEGENLRFTAILFLSAWLAGMVGLPFMAADSAMPGLIREMRTVFFPGLFLGSVNVGSVYFLISALQVPTLESSVVFPLNNVGVILLSSLTAAVIFGEKPTMKNYLGLIMAVLAMVFLFLSDFNYRRL